MNRLAITDINIKNKNYTAYIALNEKRDFVDFELYSSGKHILNNIYIGRVEYIVENIGAVFVKISAEQNCFLPFNEAKRAIFTKKQSTNKLICKGDELLVQIVKEAVKTKDPVASTMLTLNGTYSVLTTKNTGLNASKKLPQEVRTSHKKLLESLCANHEEMGYGMVLRTNSALAGEEELKADIQLLSEQYTDIVENSRHLSAYTNVYQPYPEYIRRLQTVRSFVGDAAKDNAANNGTPTTQLYDGIYTDIPEIKTKIEKYLPYLAKQKLVHFYDDTKVALQTLYNIEGNVGKLLSDKVWLSSGANIIIEQLETLTVIDVNSAKNLKGSKNKDLDSVLLSINKEAAKEAVRQIRLRNISGMILIDFINIKKKELEDELISYLKSELKQDVVPCKFIDITKLGLVEITRKKVQKSLKEVIDEESGL
jgi:ribonuclease G